MTVYPFINVAAVSMSEFSDCIANPMMIFPRHLNFAAYGVVLKHPLTLSSYQNTIITTLVGTSISMLLTILTAFPLSRDNFSAKPFFVYMIIFTMLFNGGLIPNYFLVRSLGMYDKLWALILPSALSAYNIILLISFFKSIPQELVEAAKIDGAKDWQVLARIVLPMSLPILATLSLFYAVGRWNSFFNAIIYIRNRNLWTMQLLLREVVLSQQSVLANAGNADDFAVPTLNIRYATIIVSILPILALYPFMQRYFVKGVMIGAIKG